jgi:hypothetical protein
VIGQSTLDAIGLSALVAEPLGDLTLKGKHQTVRAYVVKELTA